MKQKCIVICHKQLGDMTLLEPVLAKLAAAYQGEVSLVTRSGHAPLISLMEGVKQIGHAWLKSFDALYCYDDLDKSAIHAFFTLSPKKELLLRSPTEISRLHPCAFDEIRAPGLESEYLAEYNFRHTVVDSPVSYRPPQLQQPPSSWKPQGFNWERYLFVNPTAAWKSKRWQSGAWIKVLEALWEAGTKQILISSGGQDWQIEHCRRIAAGLGDKAIFLEGQTSLQEYLWLVANAPMVLGVDSSASHLAAAFGNRSVTLFIRTNHLHWHDPQPHAQIVKANFVEDTDTYEIDPDVVIEKALAMWNKS